jgi:glycosyltransferase involved in cell wall biosynthesis
MLISTLLPVRNGRNFVQFALSSVMAQTLPSNEIFVIDDHSTDCTHEIVEKEFPNTIVFRSAGNGQAAALNEGILKSTGELITFIDHDDEWSPAKNEIQHSSLIIDEKIDVVVGGVANFASAEGNSLKRFGPSRVLGACMFRREVFDRVGLFDTSLGYHAMIEWWGRKEARNLRIHEIHEDLYFRRIHEENGGKLFKEKSRQDLLRILKQKAKNDVESN